MDVDEEPIQTENNKNEAVKQPGKRGRKPGRKSVKSDMRDKLERSRQSARECRARKKLRYQYLEDLAATTEKAVLALYKELDLYLDWARELDDGRIPDGLARLAEEGDGARPGIVDGGTL